MSNTYFCCACEGGSLFDLTSAAMRASQSSWQTWPQLQNRTVICTHLGRTAIWQMCRLWGFGKGDEVLLPAYNCGSEVDPFIKADMTPILFRVDREATVDLDDIRRRTTARTRVIYVTHYFGWPQRIGELATWCRRHDIKLVEDCAMSLFSEGPEGPLGTNGDAAIFSVRKFLPVPDGGILTLKASVPDCQFHPPSASSIVRGLLPIFKNQLLRAAESLRIYSVARKASVAFQNERSQTADEIADYPDIPADYYLDLQSRNRAMSRLTRNMLGRFDVSKIIARRRENYLALSEGLRNVHGVRPLYGDLGPGVCPLDFTAFVPARNEFVRRLNAHGIRAFALWPGYHRGLEWAHLPEARLLKDNLISLPVHPELGPDHLRFMCGIIQSLAKELM